MTTPQRTNDLGQPIGPDVPGWQPRPRPPRTPMEGRTVRLEPFDVDRHAADLFEANAADPDGRMWTYLTEGPFGTYAAYRDFIHRTCTSEDPLFFTVLERSPGSPVGRALGVASHMRIEPATGVIEVGWITFSPALQRTVMATEAMYLMMARAFDALGYRRYEWKCDALNGPSKRAAKRLGFTYEGTFRQATIYRGRNRDTTWFSILDTEWPAIKAGFEAWLAPENFDDTGRQRRTLEACREAVRHG